MQLLALLSSLYLLLIKIICIYYDKTRKIHLVYHYFYIEVIYYLYNLYYTYIGGLRNSQNREIV